jgi:hypothetical protein
MVVSELPIFIAVRNLTARHIDRYIDRVGERGAFLNMVIGDESNDTLLRKHSRILIDRAVAEAQGEPRGNSIPTYRFNNIACGDASAFEGLYNDESVRRTLKVVSWDGCCLQATA